MSITRFEGISVPGWAGPRPGGGYEGITKALDRAVLRHAKALNAWLGHGLAIQIRFNADRLSGGAWVDDRHGAVSIGLNAGYRGDGRGTPIGAIEHDVGVAKRLLAPGARLPKQVRKYTDSVFIPVRGTHEGLRLLKRLIDPGKLADYLGGIPTSSATGMAEGLPWYKPTHSKV